MTRVTPDASSLSAADGGALEEPLLARESPDAAAARQLRHEQEALLHGPLLALREQHEAEADSGAPSAVSRLARELGWREWALLAGGLVAACGFGATPALQARLMGNVFSGGAGADPHALRNNIERNVPRLLELGAFAFMCGYLQLLLLSTMGERVVRRVKARCLAAMLRQEVAFFDSKSTGQLATLLAEQSQALLKGLSDSVGQGVQFTAQIVVSYTIAFHTNAHVAVTLMGILPVLSILVVMLILVAIRTFKKLDKVNEQAGGLAEEMLSAYQTVASFTSEPRAVAKYDAVLGDAEQLGLKLVAIRSVGVSVLFTLLYATFGMSYWYGSQLIADGKSDFGSVLTTVFTCIIGAMSIGGFVPVAQGLGQTNTAVRSLFAIIDRRPRMAGAEEAAAAAEGDSEDEDEQGEGRRRHQQQQLNNHLDNEQQQPKTAASGTAAPRLDGPVCFDNVSFAYANRATGVLSGVSFTALPGQTTALVGGSGSGKSTCISLLERFYDVTGGQITLSGVPLHRIDVHHLRRSIGLVQQEPVMFQLSVADNIWLGMDGPKDMARIETAARSANAHAFITAWPQGYDTDMGSGGTQVSGGQRQRIAIARAIVRDPAILCLDEATSALDNESERVVQAALDALLASRSRTTIVVAHRLSTVRNADRIVVFGPNPLTLGGGSHVAEQGTHDELLARRGAYHHLWELGDAELLARANSSSGDLSLLRRRSSSARSSSTSPSSASSPRGRGTSTVGLVSSSAALLSPSALGLAAAADEQSELETPLLDREQLELQRQRQQQHQQQQRHVLDDDDLSVDFGQLVRSASMLSSADAAPPPSPGLARAGKSQSASGGGEAVGPAAAAAVAAAAAAGEDEGEDRYPVSRARLWGETRGQLQFLVAGIVAAGIKGGINPATSIILSSAMASFVLVPHPAWPLRNCTSDAGCDASKLEFCGEMPLGFALCADGYLEGHAPEDVRHAGVQTLVTYVLIGVVIGASMFVNTQSFGRASQVITHRLKRQMFEAYMRMDAAFFDKPRHQVGVLVSRLATDPILVQNVTADYYAMVVENVLGVCVGLVIALVASWRMTLVILLPCGLLVLASFLRMRQHAQEKVKTDTESGKVVNQALSSVRTVYSCTAERAVAAHYEQYLRVSMRAGVRSANVSGLANGLAQCLFQIVYAFSFWAGSEMLERGWLDSKALSRVFFVLTLTAQGVGQSFARASDTSKADVSISRIYRLLDDRRPIDYSREDGRKPAQLRGRITFDNVTFAYPERPQVTVLANLSLEIAPGETVAFVGASGSGKSSIIRLLERFYDPQHGAVRYDDVDLRSYNIAALRRHVALVDQQPVLFNASITDNVGEYGIPRAELDKLSRQQVLDRVVQACKASHAHGFIAGFPAQYDTACGAKGLQMSGGQKQRIAIARALAKDPAVLLLDEATSALDNQSEKDVQAALDNLVKERSTRKRTIVIVAHRLSTVKHADRIIVLEKGQVVQQGKHADLFKDKDGPYYRLYTSQPRSEP